MKFKKYFFLAILILMYCRCGAEAIELHFKTVIGNKTIENGKNLFKEQLKSDSFATYEALFEINRKFECVAKNDCFLYLGQVNDSYAIEINGKPFYSKMNDLESDYTSFESSNIFIPLMALDLEGKNQIRINVKDLNKSVFGLLDKKIFISSKNKVYFASVKDSFIRTGSSLISIYNLIVISCLLVMIYLFSKDIRILFVLLYCSVAQVYLLSFSEIPRLFLDPETMSGAVHFPLRLLQDFVLFLCFSKILPDLHKKPVKVFSFLYILVIFIHGSFYFIFGSSFRLQEMIITIAAPLVALPATYVLFNAFKNIQLRIYKKIFPFAVLFFICQANDLLNFWKIINTFYAVKIYIPFTVLLMMYIIVNDFYEKIIIERSYASMAKLTARIAHDIRSPLIALNMIREKIEKNSEVHHLLDITVQRIQTIASDVLKNRKEIMEPKPTSCITASIDMVLEEVFQEKKLIYPNILFKKIKNESSEKSFFAQVKTTSKPDELGRIFSNLIDNSAQALIEAKVKNAEIQYEMICENDQFLIQVFDNGPGIKAEILPFIGDKEVTTKSNGNGIALAYAKKLLASWGGDLFFESELNKFTKVTIKLLRV